VESKAECWTYAGGTASLAVVLQTLRGTVDPPMSTVSATRERLISNMSMMLVAAFIIETTCRSLVRLVGFTTLLCGQPVRLMVLM